LTFLLASYVENDNFVASMVVSAHALTLYSEDRALIDLTRCRFKHGA